MYIGAFRSIAISRMDLSDQSTWLFGGTKEKNTGILVQHLSPIISKIKIVALTDNLSN